MPAAAPAASRCARCGSAVWAGDLACSLCGDVLRREAPRPAFRAPALASVPAEPPLDGRWLVLGIGVLLAPVLTLTPLLRYVGWFLASLVHETGHTAAAWLFGCPAFPAIRLDGHAVAIHRDQQPFLCALVLLGLLAFAWSSRSRPRRLAVAIALVVGYPIAAFTEIHEGVFLLAGHLGELAFAAYALSRAVDGGFTGTLAERLAHSAVGCYLVGRSGVLAIGLLTSDTARATYASNGSFGLENDLLRFSRGHLHTASVGPSAFVLLALTLGVVAFAVVLACRREEAA